MSYTTQAQREIYILKTPDHIYNKADDLLTAEIEHRNQITLLKLDKFCSNKSQKIYLKITLDNSKDKERVCRQGILHLFNARLPARAKYYSASQNAFSTASSSRIYSGPSQSPSTYTTDHNPATTQIPHISPSVLPNGNALPPSRHWPSPKTQPHTMTYPNSTNAQESLGLLSPPPGLVISQQLNEADIRDFLYAIITLCDELSKGVENPETFVLYYNQTLERNGHSPIKIPQSVIDSSKRMFSSKNASKQILPVLQRNQSHHNPSQCPSISTFSLPTTPISRPFKSTLLTQT